MNGASLDRLRVDNIGSMLRPPALQQAFEQYQHGQLSAAGLTRAQDEVISQLVAQQEQHDLPIVVDGEFRRGHFMESFADVAGFDRWARRQEQARMSRGLDTGGLAKVVAPSALAQTAATEPLWLRRNLVLEEYRFAQALTDRPVKATLIGPDRIFQCYDEPGSTDVYPDAGAFLADVVRVQREMVGGLVADGCRYVHMDAPGYTAYVDPDVLDRMRGRGIDPDAAMAMTIRAENAVIAEFPGVTFGIHLCRGNERSHWHREGSYDAIAERLFGELQHQRLLLEYDTERAGGFAPLRFVPAGKTVVLGLVTTKVGALESIDGLCRRIDEAARYLPADQLAISPQCGFASTIEGNNLTEAQQWAKIDLVCQVAEKVWGR